LVEPLRDEEPVLVLRGVRHLVEVLRLERDEHALAPEHRGGRRIGGGQHVGGNAPGVDLLLKAPQHRRAAGAEQLDLDAVFLLEGVGDLLRLRQRRRGVPDHLAFGFRLRQVGRVLRQGRGRECDQRCGRENVTSLEHCSLPFNRSLWSGFQLVCTTLSAVMRGLDPRIHAVARHASDLREASVAAPIHGWPGQARP
jgi:hypothetical protein